MKEYNHYIIMCAVINFKQIRHRVFSYEVNTTQNIGIVKHVLTKQIFRHL